MTTKDRDGVALCARSRQQVTLEPNGHESYELAGAILESVVA